MSTKEKTSLIHWSGTTQNQRLLKAQLPSYVKIDERETADLLAFAAEYSKLVKYYSPNNSEAGTWDKFVSNDISVFIASIISTDLRQIEREHSGLISRLENAPRLEEKMEALEGLFAQTIDIYKRIDGWYNHTLVMTRLNPNDSSELENELENAIKQQLAANLNVLLQYRRDLGFEHRGELPDGIIAEKFHSIWFKHLDTLAVESLITNLQTPSEKLRAYSKQIRVQFRTIYSVLAYIIQTAPRFLKKTLESKEDHRPDMGLYIAFLELFKHAQNQLNTLTEKHLDFYYYDVLRMQQRGANPDRANVYFRLADHIDTHFLPKGTPLQAGVYSDGTEMQFLTDEDITLNKAQIAELKTLFISKNPKIGIGSSYRLISNVYAAPIANSKNGVGERFINDVEDWPTFGEELLDKIENERQMTFGDVGFAMSAPILEMEEGFRTVQIHLTFDKTSMHTLNLLVKDISQNKELKLNSKEDAFSRVFKNSLRVFTTSPQGWIKADVCEVKPPEDWDKPQFTLVATFKASAPSIVGYDKNIHGEGFDTTAPVLKVLHQNQDSIFSYSFLKELLIEQVKIDVTATGLRRLALSSDLGNLDPSLPFQPFGPLPKVGSYLLIGKAELFKKELTNLDINIEWHNPVDHPKGLRGHYREYELGITNDAYRISVSALTDGQFKPAADDVPLSYNLFEEHPERAGMVSKYTTLSNVDIQAFNIRPVPTLSLPAAFSNDVRDGYLKVELTSPKVAFGHEQYSNIYTKIVTNNALEKKKENLPLPNQPYVPFIKSLTVDYSATSQVNIISIGTVNKGEAVEEQLYHIHPYGIIRTFHKGKTANRSLVPTYDEDAYLYIGLQDLTPPSSLSLYFELRDAQGSEHLFLSSAARPETIWSYLSNDEWKEFSQTQILTDTTNGFNNSGIISLDIPRDLTDKNHILHAGLHWLRVAVKGDATRMPRTLKIASQAVSATFTQKYEDSSRLSKPLVANSITSMSRVIAEVREVSQPFKSLGGRAAESKPEFYTRISERLRHKNRAVSAWDYERLILEAFPDIFQVKCVTHLGYEQHVEKGNISVTVVPRIDPDNLTVLPRVNFSMLQNIREFLQAHTSPFVNIEVRNPIYERVKITAGVRFTKGKNNGTFLKKLNQDLLEFMCPWLTGGSQELDLGGMFSKDVILSFIEKRPYMDFVTKFSAVQVFYDDKRKISGFDIDDTAIDTSSSPVIQASRPWSVLIPFEMHSIYLMDDVAFQNPEEASINTMHLDMDFVMTEDKKMDLDYRTNNKRRR